MHDGSAPRLWGQRVNLITQGALNRFSPTPVGTTHTKLVPHSAHTVQPHACGDNAEEFATLSKDDGSAPRLWGQHCP